MKSMVMLDANMILRYLLNDNQRMADTAEEYLNSGDVSVTIEVIAEVVYVLKGVYSMEQTIIAETVGRFLELVDCPEMDVLRFALDAYGAINLDFVDCVLYGYHTRKGTVIATFDKKLLKLVEEPS